MNIPRKTQHGVAWRQLVFDLKIFKQLKLLMGCMSWFSLFLQLKSGDQTVGDRQKILCHSQIVQALQYMLFYSSFMSASIRKDTLRYTLKIHSRLLLIKPSYIYHLFIFISQAYIPCVFYSTAELQCYFDIQKDNRFL